MVVKLGSKSLTNALSLRHDEAEVFATTQWTKNIQRSVLFLIYRWLLSFFFIGIVSYSWTNSIKGEYFGFWFIYMTNWGIVICMIFATFAAVFVTLYHFEWITLDSQSTSYKVYWFLSSVSTVLAFVITVVYWAILFNGTTSTLDVLIHGGNSAGMLLDLLVVRHPMKFFHFIYPIFIGLIYMTFSIVYYFAGGLDSAGNNYIYHVLKWEEPGKASMVAVGILVLSIFLHVFACVLQILRKRLHKRIHKVSSMTINNNGQQTV